jgi:type IV pilus assembly protein PilA
MNYPKPFRAGFTLVEIMIVVAIIALLAALAVPSWQKIRLRSLCSIMDNDARQLASAAQQYYMENSTTTVAVGYLNGAITGPLASACISSAAAIPASPIHWSPLKTSA